MKIIFLSISLLLLSSCNFNAFFPQHGYKKSNRFKAEDVKLIAGDTDKKYEVLGSIAIDVIGNEDRAKKYIKEKAAEAGANGVIHLKLTFMSATVARIGLNGVAVRFVEN